MSTSPVYFGPDGCGTCGRKDPDHAEWCAEVGRILALPAGSAARRFRAALPALSDSGRFGGYGVVR